MSLDYPNRDEWLAARATPRKLPPRGYLHVSTRINFVFKSLSRAGVTYNIGRNAAKRTKRK